MEQANHMWVILTDFCNQSGQSVSLHKFSIWFSSNTPKSVQIAIRHSVNIPRAKGLGIYLGFRWYMVAFDGLHTDTS